MEIGWNIRTIIFIMITHHVDYNEAVQRHMITALSPIPKEFRLPPG